MSAGMSIVNGNHICMVMMLVLAITYPTNRAYACHCGKSRKHDCLIDVKNVEIPMV